MVNKPISASISHELFEDLEETCRRLDRSKGWVIKAALKEFIEKNKTTHSDK